MHRVLIVAAILSLTGCSSEPLRLIEARIERNGVFMLQMQFGVADDATPAQIWAHVSQHRFKVVGAYMPDAADPQKMVLKGKVRIELRNAGDPVAAAEVEELRLTGIPGTTEYWMLPQAEVERTRKAAGL